MQAYIYHIPLYKFIQHQNYVMLSLAEPCAYRGVFIYNKPCSHGAYRKAI